MTSPLEVIGGVPSAADRALSAVESMQEGIITVNVSREVLFMNAAAQRMTGWHLAEALGEAVDPIFRIVSYELAGLDWNPVGASIKDDEVYSLLPHSMLIRKDGSRIPVQDSIGPVHDDHGNVVGATIVFSDVSATSDILLRAMRRANHDPLTGLPNRLLLNDRITQSMALLHRHEHIVAMIFIDLDSFKAINDTEGHAAGDELLKVVAKRLLGCLRPSDTVCRLGGDEFAILLPDILHMDDVMAVATKLLAVTRMPFVLGKKVLYTSASIGVAIRDRSQDSPEMILKDADVAMYGAKNKGGDRVELYYDPVSPQIRRPLSFEGALCRALEKSEFVLHYQPQVNLSTGRIVGAEALLRWNSPDEGLLQPGSFVSIAERCDLIVPIGRWVLREAVMQQRRWKEQGYFGVLVSANVSALELNNQDYLEAADAILREVETDETCVVLELTESILLNQKEEEVATLMALSKRGVQLAIDDFGTGYSSLTYLRRYPINIIKIDRGFIADCTTGEQDCSLVRAIVSMGKSLNKVVIAEGVETLAQFNFLKEVGCDQGQGFYFSPPLPADEFDLLLKNSVGWSLLTVPLLSN